MDLFDYSSGEPNPSYRTVLRTLKVSNEYVLRILINMASIERTFLAETRPEGQRIVDDQSHGGIAWTADLYRIQSYGYVQYLKPIVTVFWVANMDIVMEVPIPVHSPIWDRVIQGI